MQWPTTTSSIYVKASFKKANRYYIYFHQKKWGLALELPQSSLFLETVKTLKTQNFKTAQSTFKNT